MHHVQTKKEIESTLDEAGLHPRKNLGQHFLIDGNLMRRIVEEAQIDTNDLVIEIGGGTGGLTDLLIQQAGHVLCVELDRDLQHILQDRFQDHPHFTLIAGDALEKKHHLHPNLILEMNRHKDQCKNVKLVANLPYQIATPLVMNLLVDYPQVQRLVFTVQAEVGDRITAQPNTRAYGPLSIVSQTLCKIATIARLLPHVFWPKPAVESVMIRMDVQEPPFSNRETIRKFSSFVRATFEHRRKTLRSALGYVIDETRREHICQSIDSSRRPETFTKEEWLNLFQLANIDSK